MKSEYVLPALGKEAFNCPNCHVYAKQKWFHLRGTQNEKGYGLQFDDERFLISHCEHCGYPTIWFGEQVVFPLTSSAEPPNPDLPEQIKRDYDEARTISNLSPRGAAALLRLAIQKLCKHLDQPGDNINADIKALVAAGLPSRSIGPG